MWRIIFFSWFFCFSVVFSSEPSITTTLQWSGQYKSRTVYTKAFSDSSSPVFFTGMRMRLGALAKPSRQITICIEAQDIRRFGSEPMAIPGRNETRTLSPKGGALNLSRGFFQVDKNWVRVTMGRQRFSLGTQRFVGEYDWDHQGRAFDGIRYEFPQTGVGELSFGLFGVGDSLQFLSKDNHTFTFLDFSSISWQAHSLGLYGAYYQSGKNAQDFTYFYGGTRIGGHIKRVFYQLETIFQIGEKQSADKSALAGGLEFGLIWSDSNFFALGTDFMSGSGSGRSKRQYNSPFYSAHRFFGDLDLFENNPIGGVIDLFGEFFVQIHRTIRAKVAGHIFRLYARDKLYGYEGTFNIEGRFFPKSALTIGFDTFIPGAGAKLLMSTGQAADEAIWRMYIMPNFWF